MAKDLELRNMIRNPSFPSQVYLTHQQNLDMLAGDQPARAILINWKHLVILIIPSPHITEVEDFCCEKAVRGQGWNWCCKQKTQFIRFACEEREPSDAQCLARPVPWLPPPLSACAITGDAAAVGCGGSLPCTLLGRGRGKSSSQHY